MKYYAVTEDPNELMHYGVKGMKWGQHIFGDRPKSAAYKRAAGKLSSSMRNGIAKARANWKAAHSPAVMRAKAKVKALKKEQRAFRRETKFMNKALQEAREGRLKYGRLTDDQVRRVTERLALERNARQLGNTEKPKFKKQIKAAMREGTLQGTVRGTSAVMEEVARAMTRNALSRKEKKALNKLEEQKRKQMAKERKQQEDEKYESDLRNKLRDMRFEQTGKITITRREKKNTNKAAKSLFELQQKQKWAEARKKLAAQQREEEAHRRREEEAMDRRIRELQRRQRLGLPMGGGKSGNKK